MNQLARIATLATALSPIATTVAFGQRSRGTMGAPTVTQAPATRPAPAPPPSRGTMYVPRQAGPTGPRGGDLPRIVSEPSHRTSSGYGNGSGYTYGNGAGYGTRDRGGRYDGNDRSDRGDRGDRGGRYSRPPYTTSYTPAGPYTRYSYPSATHRPLACGYGCVHIGGGLRSARVFANFWIGYPLYVPIMVPYIYDATYVRYGEAPVEAYVPAPQADQFDAPRAASKLIVVGTGSAGGDALTVETVGDSVRLSWIASGRTAREVKLFVSDSGKRELASRSASPSAPNATFEVATLSAPVAFAGVSVTFTDGVTSTTMVPYRNGAASIERR